MHSLWLALLQLLLLLSLATPAWAAKYGEACSKVTDCEEKKAPFCSIFFTDKSYDFNGMPRDNDATYTPDEFVVALEKIDNVRQQQGVCVACITDCDCAVHEFCGYDFDEKYEKDSNEWTYEYKVKIPSGITSTNEGGGMPKIAKQELELYAMQYEGLPMKSTCKKYSTSHVKKGPKVCDAKIGMSFFAKMVEESLLSGAFRDVLRTCDIKNGSESQGSRTRVKRTPSKWPKEARDRFCGRILSWGAAFHTIKYIGQVQNTSMIKNAEFQLSTTMSTGNHYDDAARCVPAVVAENPVTCPSCLHQASNMYWPPRASCSNVRKDELVCCRSKNWGTGSANARTCHDSIPEVVSYSPYATCETTCTRPSTHNIDYYVVCKIPDDGAMMDAMTKAPINNDTANTKTWCECVQKCLVCTGNNGGIGERPKNLKSIKSGYEGIHGTCAPPPVRWEKPTSDSGAPPQFTPADTHFICADTEETCAVIRQTPQFSACKPLCVDCLVAAMQYKCDGKTDVAASCPNTTVSAQGSCTSNGRFQQWTDHYEYNIDSNPVEYEGVCQKGDCKACIDGSSRCESENFGSINPQFCFGGEWVSKEAYNKQDPALNIQTQIQIATAAMLGLCFLALLGNIAATCMIK